MNNGILHHTSTRQAMTPTAFPARESGHLPLALERSLAQSPYVYVSPLRSDGHESACHSQLWFGWMDGSIVVSTGVKSWRARCIDQGLTRARIWVGDHGSWKQPFGSNDAFRRGPSLFARASALKEPALLRRLLAIYDAKYSVEIAQWRGRILRGFEDGSRLLIRYTPERATPRD